MHNNFSEKKDIYFLSDAQYAFLLGRQSDKSLGGVSCHIYIETEGKNLCEERLVAAWNELRIRHKALCAKISSRGEVIFVSPEELHDTVKIEKLNFDSVEVYEKKIAKLRNSIKSRLMDISNGELAGLIICLLPDNVVRLMFDFDCVGYDITSFQIILRDFAYIYSGVTLPSLPAEFNPYADIKLKSELTDKKIIAKEYWQKKALVMGNVPSFPLSRNIEDFQHASYTAHSMYLDDDCFDAIKNYSAVNGSQLETVLLAVFVKSISNITGDNHFILNIPILGREDLDENLKNTVADYTEIMIFDADCRDITSFDKLFFKLNSDFIEDKKHMAFSGIKVQKLLKSINPESYESVPVTFSSHVSIDLTDEIFCRNIGNLKYMTSQTPKVTMDGQFFIINNRLYVSLVTVDGLFKDNLEGKLLNEILYTAKSLIENNKGSASMPSEESIYKFIEILYTDLLNLQKDFDKNLSFNNLGGNSISSSKLQFEILKQYGVKISFKELFINGTISQLSELIIKKLKEDK